MSRITGAQTCGRLVEPATCSPARQAGTDPWQGASVRWPVDSTVEGVVKRIAEFGAFVELSSKDVVRHRIVAAIVEAYQRFDGEGDQR